MSLFRKQQHSQTDQLQQVTAIKDRIRSMRDQMGTDVQLTDLFSMLNEDERRIFTPTSHARNHS